ncbi:thioredoxin-disulfide reductase [Thermotomaculum hydrothermale]|uniref:Thioredoxin-disulfide reductase n=1 Tax=Thermotomaculum hydrothermale TaxID=981385 RepID=A0A7R6PFY4_9BACT|nr:thioredoxin family protein [Thermotomaculum hydrothermale]BBB31869.1 thioredoxin-disulfide reductase [Thermotomaculum hydrothermale]
MKILYIGAAIIAALFILKIILQIVILKKAKKNVGVKLSDILPDFRGKDFFVYLYSPSCTPCIRLTPHIKNLISKGVRGKMVDVTKNMEVARKLGIMATPSVVIVKDGYIKDILMGLIKPEDIEKQLNQ